MIHPCVQSIVIWMTLFNWAEAGSRQSKMTSLFFSNWLQLWDTRICFQKGAAVIHPPFTLTFLSVAYAFWKVKYCICIISMRHSGNMLSSKWCRECRTWHQFYWKYYFVKDSTVRIHSWWTYRSVNDDDWYLLILIFVRERDWHFFGNPVGHGIPAEWEPISLIITLTEQGKKVNGIRQDGNYSNKSVFIYINMLL